MIKENYNPEDPIKLSSPEFENNGIIPIKFSCKWLNINPTIIIHAINPNTESLVLIMDDPDAPMWTRDHRILRNIPITDRIEENSVPEWAIQWKNSRWENKYWWPCPPNWTHRYFFKIYALDTKLNIPSSSTKSNLEQAMQWHIIEKAEIVWLFTK